MTGTAGTAREALSGTVAHRAPRPGRSAGTRGAAGVRPAPFPEGGDRA